jgi:hypothetical protein
MVAWRADWKRPGQHRAQLERPRDEDSISSLVAVKRKAKEESDIFMSKNFQNLKP